MSLPVLVFGRRSLSPTWIWLCRGFCSIRQMLSWRSTWFVLPGRPGGGNTVLSAISISGRYGRSWWFSWFKFPCSKFGCGFGFGVTVGVDGIGDWVGWRFGVGCTSTTGWFKYCLVGLSKYDFSSWRVDGPGCGGGWARVRVWYSNCWSPNL